MRTEVLSCEGSRPWAAMQAIYELGEEDRGSFQPNAIVLTVGPDSIVDLVSGRTVASNVFLSVSIWGYGYPDDPLRFTQIVESLEPVVEFRNGVEAVVGETEMYFYME